MQKFKMAGRLFWGKSPEDSGDTLRVKHFVNIALTRTVCQLNTFFFCIFAFYTEIEGGFQKWQENNFCEKLPDDYADILRGKNAKIDLFHTVSEINVFLCITYNAVMTAKNGKKTNFGKNCHFTVQIL